MDRLLIGLSACSSHTETLLFWIEKLIVVACLHQVPNDNGDDDVREVLLDEKISYRSAHSWPAQPSFGVDLGVDSYHDEQRQDHFE